MVLSSLVHNNLLRFATLNNHGRCPKTLKVLKNLEKSKVEALFGAPANKNGYKCDDLELIAFIENL
jgi:hypothetical protein